MRQKTPRKQVEKHGDTRGDGFKEREYVCWTQLIQRCINPDNHAYARYGGRGIKVCRRWKNSYVAFLRDMGRKPSPKHSIERIDNDGNYEPGNCRWSLQREQARNKSNNNKITAFGKRRCVTDWARDLGVDASAITSRLAHGWSAEEAVSIPAEVHGPFMITHNGETLSAAEWSRRSGVAPRNIVHRAKVGIDTASAIFQKEPLTSGRKPSRFITVDDVTMSVSDWARDKGIDCNTIFERLKAGWAESDAVLIPVGDRRPGTGSKLIHGTIAAYAYHKCRCDLCKEAKRLYRKAHS